MVPSAARFREVSDLVFQFPAHQIRTQHQAGEGFVTAQSPEDRNTSFVSKPIAFDTEPGKASVDTQRACECLAGRNVQIVAREAEAGQCVVVPQGIRNGLTSLIAELVGREVEAGQFAVVPQGIRNSLASLITEPAGQEVQAGQCSVVPQDATNSLASVVTEIVDRKAQAGQRIVVFQHMLRSIRTDFCARCRINSMFSTRCSSSGHLLASQLHVRHLESGNLDVVPQGLDMSTFSMPLPTPLTRQVDPGHLCGA